MSSMVLTTSGKPLRKSAASSSPVWFQSSCCSLRTRSLFSCADIGLSLPGSPTDHNTACMMPLEDIRCTLALCPNREAREEAEAGVGSLPPSSGWKPVGHLLGAATSVRRYRNLQRGLSPCARTRPSSPLLHAGSLPCPLLPDAARERVAEHELPVRYGCRRRRDLLGALLRDLLVGDGFGELTDPKPTGVPGGAVGR